MEIAVQITLEITVKISIEIAVQMTLEITAQINHVLTSVCLNRRCDEGVRVVAGICVCGRLGSSEVAGNDEIKSLSPWQPWVGKNDLQGAMKPPDAGAK